MSRASKTSDISLKHSVSSRSSKDERKLSHVELLELLVQLSSENDALKEENARLREQLEDRSVALTEAGSIAEASLRLNGVFEAAQRAADDYLNNVKRLAGAGSAAVPNLALEAVLPSVETEGATGGRHAKGVL